MRASRRPAGMFRATGRSTSPPALGVAVREYPTSVGPADYALFVDRQAVGVIEAKPDSWGHKITTVEEQSAGYAAAKLNG